MPRHLDSSPKPISSIYYVATAWLRVRCVCGHATSLQPSDLMATGSPRETRYY